MFHPVWKSKVHGAFALNHRVVLHAIDATPARWRRDAGSSPLDRASTAAFSPRNDLVKNCRVHPTHWLISTQVSHTGKISASDVMACAAGLGVKVDAEDVRKWISSHDIAGDGELSRDEFQKMMATMSAAEEFRHGEKYLTKL